MTKGPGQGPFYADCSVELTFGDPSANNKKYSFENCRISRDDISGINLEQIDSNFRIGTIATLSIRLVHTADAKLKVKASVYKVTTPDGIKFGLSYHSDEFQASLINKYLNEHGVWKSPYLRNSPRIVVSKTMPLIPVWATLFLSDSAGSFDHMNSIVLEVVDISPVGIQLMSECKNSFRLKASEAVTIFLEPRGSESQKIKLQGQIVRISDGIHWDSGNQFRSLGIKLSDSNHQESATYHEFFRRMISEIEG